MGRNHGRYADISELTRGHMKLHKNCNFFQIQGHFLLTLYWKAAETWDIVADVKLHKNCKKLHFFWKFQYKYTVNRPKNGRIAAGFYTRNSRAKRRIRRYVWAALRIMRGPSPTRTVGLLRRDVFVLKIRAEICGRSPAHIFRWGLRSKPHGTYVRIYTCDMTQARLGWFNIDLRTRCCWIV